MATGNPAGFKLTEDEAFALLAMCLTSPHQLDATSEQALRKLAEYCISTSNHTNSNQLIELSEYTASTA
jgi:hypothetical protein